MTTAPYFIFLGDDLEIDGPEGFEEVEDLGEDDDENELVVLDPSHVSHL